jgi:heat shock protein HtpX
MRRRALFPADRGLQLRMVVAAVLTPLGVLAALVAVAALLPLKVALGVAFAALLGIGTAIAERARNEDTTLLGPGTAPELHAIVERLAVAADLPKPEIALDREAQPNSWVIDLPGRPPRLHVTTGLLELLDARELEAVVAHELSHVAHRDATVMTVVGMPGAVLRAGGAQGFGAWFLMFGQLVAAAIGQVAGLGTNALSRYRELAADAGAVALTGRPSALASALMKVSGRLGRLPADDLRVAAGRNAFHLLPVGEPRRAGLARLLDTHPSLECRLAAIERHERRLQGARIAGPVD